MNNSIVLFPNAILREKSNLVDLSKDDINLIIDNMIRVMKSEGGIGLAAIQIGILKRIFIVQLEEDDPVSVFINPEIIEFSEEKTEHREGCLSIPKTMATLSIRSKNIKLKYFNLNGKECLIDASDLLAICIQHEMDHLNGILFIDHLSQVKRDNLLRQYFKKLKAKE